MRRVRRDVLKGRAHGAANRMNLRADDTKHAGFVLECEPQVASASIGVRLYPAPQSPSRLRRDA